MSTKTLPLNTKGISLRPEDFPDLPDEPGPGEYRCTECGNRVTVSKNGTEYGHRPRQRGGPCPRRPANMLTSLGRRARGLAGGDD